MELKSPADDQVSSLCTSLSIREGKKRVRYQIMGSWGSSQLSQHDATLRDWSICWETLWKTGNPLCLSHNKGSLKKCADKMHSYLRLAAYKKCSLTKLIFSSSIFLAMDGSLCNTTSEGSHCWTLPPYTHPVKTTIQPHALICQAGHSDAPLAQMRVVTREHRRGTIKIGCSGRAQAAFSTKRVYYLKKRAKQLAILSNFNLP